jgi:uncharacterized protein YdhG (YjbR/CyaY superfamily)
MRSGQSLHIIKKPRTVDEYISQAPKAVQEKLGALRAIIRSAAPKAQERISYGMPYYHYKGRLIYFRLSKAHIGIYIPPPIIERYGRELKRTTKATVRLPLDEKLPAALIKKLVRARAEWNQTGK